MKSRRDTPIGALLIGGLRWIALSRVLVQIGSTLASLVVVRLLTPLDFGLVATVSALVAFFGLVVDAGMSQALIQRGDVTEEVRASVRGASLIVAITGTTFALLAAPWVAHWYGHPELAHLMMLGGCQVLVISLAIVPRAELARNMRFKEQAVAFSAGGATQGIVTLALAFSGFEYWSLLGGALIGRIVEVAITIRFAGQSLAPSFSFSRLVPYVSFARYTLGDRALWYWIQNLDVLIVGQILGMQQLGVYSVAKDLSHMPLNKIGDIASQVTVAGFSRIQSDATAVVEGTRRVVQLGAVVGFSVFWGLMVVAQHVVPVVLGNQWLSVVDLFSVLCVALPLRLVWTLLTRVVVGIGRPDIAFQNQVWWFAIVLPGVAIGAFHGLVWVAVGWCATFPILFVVAARRFARVLDVSTAKMLRPLISPALAGASMVAAVIAFDEVLGTHLPSPEALALEVGIGMLVYTVVLRLVAPSAFAETLAFVDGLRGRKRPQ